MSASLKFPFHVKHGRSADLLAAAESVGVHLDEAAMGSLMTYERLLRDRAVPLGLVAESDRPRIWDRHVLDCLRAAAVVRAEDTRALDLGSGAGLPGIVVAVARPRVHVALVEPRRTRAAFLELALDRLGLVNASVIPLRVEEVADRADLCFARALAPLDVAWRAALTRLRPGGRLVYFAGSAAERPDRPLREATSMEVVETPVLESAGPLIIMSR